MSTWTIVPSLRGAKDCHVLLLSNAPPTSTMILRSEWHYDMATKWVHDGQV